MRNYFGEELTTIAWVLVCLFSDFLDMCVADREYAYSWFSATYTRQQIYLNP